MIQLLDPAIIGVQELMPSMKMDLMQSLTNYRFYGYGRTRKHLNEHSAIMVKEEEGQVEYYKTFWLSKRPETSGSRAYFSPFPRICTVCEINSRTLGCPIRVFNTHFDHLCAPARTLSVKVILGFMNELNKRNKMPTVLMGDMNARPSSRPIQILLQNQHSYKDIHLTSVFHDVGEGEATFHGFKGGLKGWTIDYVFVSEEFEVVKACINTFNEQGQYPSDHYPLVAELRLR
jgi:endonuclease/exonuclease/phosphatase family metal-dependent hydrolase